MKKLIGFTLSEVLITLVIIGVIAAITVPTMIANSNEQAIRSALRKNYQALEQAIRKYYIDNGQPLDSSILGSWDSSLVDNFLNKYYNVSCIGFSCKAQETIKYYSHDGKTVVSSIYFPIKNGLMLVDGTFISYNVMIGTHRCIIVDVNGPFKKPNVMGKDTFNFEIRSDDGKLIPGGASESYYIEKNYCNKNVNERNGWGCTAKALREN